MGVGGVVPPLFFHRSDLASFKRWHPFTQQLKGNLHFLEWNKLFNLTLVRPQLLFLDGYFSNYVSKLMSHFVVIIET